MCDHDGFWSIEYSIVEGWYLWALLNRLYSHLVYLSRLKFRGNLWVHLNGVKHFSLHCKQLIFSLIYVLRCSIIDTHLIQKVCLNLFFDVFKVWFNKLPSLIELWVFGSHDELSACFEEMLLFLRYWRNRFTGCIVNDSWISIDQWYFMIVSVRVFRGVQPLICVANGRIQIIINHCFWLLFEVMLLTGRARRLHFLALDSAC